MQGHNGPRLAASRPLGERSEPCLATKRPTASHMKSDEGLLESLQRTLETRLSLLCDVVIFSVIPL